MKSYTATRNLYGSLTNNTGSTNLTLGDQLVNDGIRKILADRNDWPFLEGYATFSTTASTQFYDLPYDIDKLKTLSVIDGNQQYSPVEITSREEWDRLNLSTNITSNVPEYYYIYAGRVGIWPMPSASSTDYSTGTIAITAGSATVTGSATTFTSAMAGRYLKTTDGELYLISAFVSTTELTLARVYNGATITGASYIISSKVITMTYKKAVKDLSAADYTTGTITLANGSTVVTGSGTTFTALMVGRYLKTSDGFWYKIVSFTSTTVIGLEKIYNGANVAGGTYTIGEMSELPESYQDLPVYYAVSQYWQMNGEVQRGREYKGLFDEGLQKLRLDWGNQSSNVEINGMASMINPNLTLNL